MQEIDDLRVGKLCYDVELLAQKKELYIHINGFMRGLSTLGKITKNVVKVLIILAILYLITGAIVFTYCALSNSDEENNATEVEIQNPSSVAYINDKNEAAVVSPTGEKYWVPVENLGKAISAGFVAIPPKQYIEEKAKELATPFWEKLYK